ncbi:MAG: DUF4272 domain-containing protein, partial [Phototrophicaceae bacterium]
MSQLRNQDARAVAYRALCLGALLKRTELELDIQDTEIDVDHTALHEKNNVLNRWLIDEHINPHLSETEYHLLAKPLGTWSERTLITVGWRTEALGIMLWALNRLDDLLSYDKQFQPATILSPLDIFNPTIDFIWLAELRPDTILSQARDQAEAWNWRSRARELKALGIRPPEGVTFNEIIRFTAEKAYHNGHIGQPIYGDFPVLGKAYVDLTTDEYNLISAIAYERNSALSWICE